jgi:hypothetical protein
MMKAQLPTRAALKSKNAATLTFLRPNFVSAVSTPKLEPFISISFFRLYLCYLHSCIHVRDMLRS